MLEIIDGLCMVIEMQAQLIRKQAETLEQENIAKEIVGELHEKRSEIEKKMDLMEYKMRHVR